MQQSFQKSLTTLLSMFEYRIPNNTNMYSKAHQELASYIESKQPLEDFNLNAIVLNFGQIRVIYNLDDKWDPRNITNRFKRIITEEGSPTKVICVLSHHNAQKLEGGKPKNATSYFIMSNDMDPEIFHISELQYNITKHSLVPYHELVTSQEEKDLIKNNYEVRDLKQLPLILSTDPMIRFIGGKPNDLVRIIRNTNHVGEHVLYRYCVKA